MFFANLVWAGNIFGNCPNFHAFGCLYSSARVARVFEGQRVGLPYSQAPRFSSEHIAQGFVSFWLLQSPEPEPARALTRARPISDVESLDPSSFP